MFRGGDTPGILLFLFISSIWSSTFDLWPTAPPPPQRTLAWTAPFCSTLENCLIHCSAFDDSCTGFQFVDGACWTSSAPSFYRYSNINLQQMPVWIAPDKATLTIGVKGEVPSITCDGILGQYSASKMPPVCLCCDNSGRLQKYQFWMTEIYFFAVI